MREWIEPNGANRLFSYFCYNSIAPTEIYSETIKVKTKGKQFLFALYDVVLI